jgi:chromosome condensin MukBEF ATPase and DNA-binding subunit MukB
MTDRNALAQQIASILDYPSIYMGAPSNRSLRYAEKIVGLLDEHIAAARAEALEEAADWLTTRHIMTEAHNTLAEELRHARDRGSFLDAVAIAERHIAAARAEALGEAKNEAQRIMRLAADSGSTGAVVGAKCVRDAIRALMEPPA